MLLLGVCFVPIQYFCPPSVPFPCPGFPTAGSRAICPKEWLLRAIGGYLFRNGEIPYEEAIWQVIYLQGHVHQQVNISISPKM